MRSVESSGRDSDRSTPWQGLAEIHHESLLAKASETINLLQGDGLPAACPGFDLTH